MHTQNALRLCLVIFSFVISTNGPAIAQLKPNISNRNKERLGAAITAARKQKIDKAAQTLTLSLIKRDQINGMLIGVVANGKIIHLGAYGYRDEAKKNKLSLNDSMGWASVGKLITAVAAWQMIENNQAGLKLSSKASAYLGPEWNSRNVSDRSRKNSITIDQLLRHRSGIYHYGSPGISRPNWKSAYSRVRAIRRPEWNSIASLQYYKDIRLANAPGSVHRYSTFGTSVLGSVLDSNAKRIKGSQSGYYDWVQKEIASKAGMSRLTVNPDYRYLLPGGGWQSNIGTKSLFMIALMNDKLVPLENMITPNPTLNGGYGRGANVWKRGTETWAGHTGSQTEVRSALAIRMQVPKSDPNLPSQRAATPVVHPEKFGVVVLMSRRNNSNVDPRSVVTTIFNAAH